MDVVEIDVFDTHLLQAAFKALVEELGTVVGPDIPLALVVDGEFYAEFGSYEDIGATLWVQLEPLPDQDLTVTVAVRCVPVCVAQLPGPVQKR